MGGTSAKPSANLAAAMLELGVWIWTQSGRAAHPHIFSDPHKRIIAASCHKQHCEDQVNDDIAGGIRNGLIIILW